MSNTSQIDLINYFAIDIIEKLGIEQPSEQQIKRVETILGDIVDPGKLTPQYEQSN